MEAIMALEVTVLQPVFPKTVVPAMLFFVDTSLLVTELFSFVQSQLPDVIWNNEYVVRKVFSSVKALDLTIQESDWKMIPQFRQIKMSQVF